MSEVDRLVERSRLRYDRTGEQHYLLASALQKSIRGSNSDAALYYLGRMLKGGEDPAFIGNIIILLYWIPGLIGNFTSTILNKI